MEIVYIETSVVSLLVANPSRDLILAGHQEATREWGDEERPYYRCVTSNEVVREASLGDPEMSRRRLEALTGMPILLVTDEARLLAKDLLAQKVLPPTVLADAIHAATASIHQANYLLTWKLPASGQPASPEETALLYGGARIDSA